MRDKNGEKHPSMRDFYKEKGCSESAAPFILLVAFSPLFAVFRLLACGTRAMRPCDVLLFAGFGLHFPGVGVFLFPTPAEVYAVDKNAVEIVHGSVMLSVMEQTDARKRHCDAVFVACFYNMVVTYASSGLCHKFHAAFVGAFYVVAEWEESVASQ